MSDYRIRENGAIISDLRAQFPNVSLPTVLSKEDYDILDIDPILEGPQPELTRFQSAVRTGPEKDAKGNWMWVYITIDWDQEAIDYATAQQWENVRQDRNRRLTDSDWTQLPDVPLTEEKKAEWTTYRQALRDVTDQSDPFEIVWPTQPE